MAGIAWGYGVAGEIAREIGQRHGGYGPPCPPPPPP